MAHALRLARRGEYSTAPNPERRLRGARRGRHGRRRGLASSGPASRTRRVDRARSGRRSRSRRHGVRNARALRRIKGARRRASMPCSKRGPRVSSSRCRTLIRASRARACAGSKPAGIAMTSGVLEARGARTQPWFRLAHDSRTAVGDGQGRCEHRRPHRTRDWREQVDYRGSRRVPMCSDCVHAPRRS